MKEAIIEIFKPDEMGRKINQSDLAKRLGVSKNIVSRWVRGHSKPSSKNIEKMLKLGFLDAKKLSKICTGK